MSNTDNDLVVLVDENDQPIGTEEKMSAHRLGKLHRAFSIFVFNSMGETMLQRRALTKYHSGGLWSNTCCSHPRPGEETLAAAHRRLQEEMGFDCDLKIIDGFTYQAPLDHELTEHEYDHLIIGQYNSPPVLNTDEAMDWKWISLNDLQQDVLQHSDRYSFWLKQALPIVAKKYANN